MAALEQLAAKPVYLICRSGARSALAADSLKNMGFTQVMSVAGGFQAWSDAGYPIER
jgi:rhodanese-related sulfurtransferase